MATRDYRSPRRTDFRCALCRQKKVFRCEHDTPYRDEFLTRNQFDPSMQRAPVEQRSSSPFYTHKNYTSNETLAVPDYAEGLPRYQYVDECPTMPARTADKTSRSRACTIL